VAARLLSFGFARHYPCSCAAAASFNAGGTSPRSLGIPISEKGGGSKIRCKDLLGGEFLSVLQAIAIWPLYQATTCRDNPQQMVMTTAIMRPNKISYKEWAQDEIAKRILE